MSGRGDGASSRAVLGAGSQRSDKNRRKAQKRRGACAVVANKLATAATTLPFSTDPPCVCSCVCGCCGRACSVAENRRERRERKGRNKPPRPKETRAERDARRAKRRAQKEEEERLRLEAERVAAEEFERKKAAEEAERRRLAEEAAAAAAAKARADAETKLVELKQQQEQRTKLRLLNSEVRPRPPQHVLSACLSWQHVCCRASGL